MLETFLFLFRYKIKKNEVNLPLHCSEFFKLSTEHQKRVIDIYFEKFGNISIDYYFNSDKARYYFENKEVSFFDSYYFCNKITLMDINNLVFIDKFGISEKEGLELIDKVLKKNINVKLDINKILVYPDNLPKRLATNVEFMKYIVSNNIYDVKYMIYNEEIPQAQRELIKDVISKARTKKFRLSKFLVKDKVLPKILLENIDFLVYIIENDINNVKYLDSKIINNFTDSNWHSITKAIIKYMDNNNCSIGVIEDNFYLVRYLNRDYEFVNYMINKDVNNIKYVDWHNITSKEIKLIIDNLALKLVREDIDFDCYEYSFNNILRENYMFMAYLIDRDKHNINKILVNDKDDIRKLVDIYLNKYRKCKFDIYNYLDDNGYVCNNLVEDKYMLSYLIRNDNNVFRYMDFVTISNSRDIVETILKEIHRKSFVFNNDSFLVNGKYPIILSNNYRFMRFVIDKNFNNLSFIDISLIDERTLKRIINYAFRMVYYIRGNNRKLNFDLEGYFSNSEIVKNDYFQECLRSLG
jgi:hypothetical protein